MIRSGAAGVEGKVPVIVVLAGAMAAAAGGPSEIHLGPVTLSSLLTLATGASLVALSPLLVRRHGRALSLALVGLLVLAAVRSPLEVTRDGLQNLLAYAILVLTPAFAARAVLERGDPASVERTADGVVRHLARWSLVAAAAFAAQLATGLWPDGTRSFALAALPLLAAAIMDRTPTLLARLTPFIVVTLVIASLSRTASVLALLMLAGVAFRRVPGRRAAAGLGLGLIVVTATLATVLAVPALRERFTSGDNASIGGVSVNTSGRSALWEALWVRLDDAPLLGHGAGAAAELVTTLFPGNRQPHNEYLRLAYDLGGIGLALFVLGSVVLLVRVARRTRSSGHPVHAAALLALIALLASAVTDNTFIYPFATLPTAVLVGTSCALGLPAPVRDRPALRAHTTTLIQERTPHDVRTRP